MEAAAAWHARLAGDASENDWEAFTAWLEADPQNRHAFDAVDAAAVLATEVLAAEVLATHTAARAPQPTAEIIPMRAPRAKAVRRAWWPAGIAAALLIGVLFYAFNAPPKGEQIATAIGQSREVKLADGSTVHLNTNTVVTVLIGHGTRGARLEKGEALFEVAPDAAHPFNVAVGDRNVHVVGTAFNIVRYDGRIAVTVKHGTVEVGPETGIGPAKVALHPGDQYVGREGAPDYKLGKIDPAVVGGWQQGQLVFDDAPLSQVAADLNRYFAKPIVIEDAAVNNLRFSGVLKIDDELVMVQRLAAFVPITMHVKADQVILERGASK
jgi:transmembrane sensor